MGRKRGKTEIQKEAKLQKKLPKKVSESENAKLLFIMRSFLLNFNDDAKENFPLKFENLGQIVQKYQNTK